MIKGNKRRTGRIVVGLALLAAVLPSPPRVALASHAQPALNHALVDYTPIGYYGPADEANTSVGESAMIPTTPPQGAPLAIPGPNPSGKFVAYDTNVWESLNLPSRHPGDNCNSLPPLEQMCEAGDRDVDTDGPQGYRGPSGGPAATHGQCPASLNPVFGPWGECFNSQLEYLDYYEQTMETMLADFGGVVHRYPFHSPGTGTRGAYLDAGAGQAYNIGAVVPGADHPEETVLVSGHYDFTDSGPAAAWDSAEGHTEVIRIAYIMADYWRKTNTRPSATVKFIPWDSEESGTFGSIDYVRNNIPPGEEDKVRGYFNMDPCAGAYPAFKDGNFNTRVPEVMQLADPAGFVEDPDNLPNDPNDRMDVFNAKAELIVDQVLNRLDDRLTTPTGEVPIFVSNAEAAAGMDDKGPVGASQRTEIVTAVGGLLIFSSDYANFENAGIPIFNLFPDYFGPHADATPGNNEGISILHTPNDNLTRINKLTSGLNQTGSLPPAPDPTGLFASEGWAKGMEFCAQTEGWYMLQPEMAGAQTRDTNPVAYYEALPNEAIQNQNVTFDGSGTYQYADVTTRALVPESELTYTWDFGDGNTLTGTGSAFKVVQHAYAAIGRYETTLTVTGRGGLTDTMGIIPVVVIGSNFPGPVLDLIPAADARDGTFPLNWTFEATRDGFQHFLVEESTDLRVLFTDDAENIATNWNISTPTHAEIEPWQASDSSTLKFRTDNPHRSGARSFWTGESPPFDQTPTIVQGTSILTMKNPITVPQEGDTELSFFSLFQNEGDDQGRVEVAQVDAQGNPGEFQAVDVTQAVNTAAGGPEDVAICDPSNPNTFTRPFSLRKASLGPFKGKSVLIRFNYLLGGENRALSQPCGWHIDDIKVTSGTFQQIGTTPNQTFQITGKPSGIYGYRVTGVYTDGIRTAPSNAESAQVEADLSVNKTDSKDPAPTGRVLTYTITVTNLGPAAAGGAVLTDTLPSTVTFVSAVASQGSCSGTATVTCNLGTIAFPGSATVTIQVKPTTLGNLSNTASVTSALDPNPANNTEGETTGTCRITSRRQSIPCG